MLMNVGGTASGSLAEIQAAKQRPRGHLSKDQRAQGPLLENITKGSGVPGSWASSGPARVARTEVRLSSSQVCGERL